MWQGFVTRIRQAFRTCPAGRKNWLPGHNNSVMNAWEEGGAEGRWMCPHTVTGRGNSSRKHRKIGEKWTNACIHFPLWTLTWWLFVGADLGTTGTYIPIWIADTIFGLPLAIFLLHNFLRQIPRELVEAARVDGTNWFSLFTKIILPLSIPAIAAFLIFQFLWVWNDLLVGLTFGAGSKNVAPMTVRLAEMVGTRGSGWEVLTAGAFVSIAVPLIVFFALQRYFVRGLLAGSVKG